MSQCECWICGAAADSAEHRFKKSDLVRVYGRGPYRGRGDDELMHFRGDKGCMIQGPNAKSIKYTSSLCYNCNTTFTQPFDHAYDILMEWLIENENHVLEKRFINFARVYGDRFEESQRNLYKYFAKSFGCRLVDAGYAVPMDVVNLLRLTHFHTGLSLTFTVNEANLIVSSSVRNGFIGKGDLIVIVKDSDPKEIRGFVWSEHISWFTIFYCYGRMPDGDLGSTWVANSQHIYLGSYQTATEEID